MKEKSLPPFLAVSCCFEDLRKTDSDTIFNGKANRTTKDKQIFNLTSKATTSSIKNYNQFKMK